MSMTFRDDPSYYESCYRCGDDAIGMTGLCHSCHESAEAAEECNAPRRNHQMSIKDLDLNTSLKLVGLVPLKLTGHCKTYSPTYQEHHFVITEVGNGYELAAADGSKEYFQELRQALQQCYLNWGE